MLEEWDYAKKEIKAMAIEVLEQVEDFLNLFKEFTTIAKRD